MNKKQREEQEFKDQKEAQEENKRRIWRSQKWLKNNVPKELQFRWITQGGSMLWLKVVENGVVSHRPVNMNDDARVQNEVCAYLEKIGDYQKEEARIDGAANKRIMEKLFSADKRAALALVADVREVARDD